MAIKSTDSAFPWEAFNGQQWDTGMNIRTYLAGQALAGFITRANITPDGLIYTASLCVKAADALIEELNK